MPSRWNQIADSLHADIRSGKLRPGEKLPTETALAEEWQVCRMTAHRAMTELHRQGLVTRKRRQGTVVSAPPAPLPVTRRTGNVGLLFFHTNDFPQVEYLHGFRAGLSEEFHLLLCDTHNDRRREADYLKRMRGEVDALCCYPTCAPENSVLLQDIRESGIPIVCLDRVPAGVEIDAVMTDNYGSTLSALRSLTVHGHQRIAFLTADNPAVSSVQERWNAYRDAMAEAGVSDPSRWVRTFPPGMGYDFDRFAQAIHDALFAMRHQPEPPTAVFCLEDYYLAATMEACERMGLSVPADLEILSFSDCPPLAPLLSRSVHRIVQRAAEMGRLAADRIQARLRGEDLPVEIVRLPARIHPASASAFGGKAI